MKFSAYLKMSVWDFVLVLACSLALGYTMLNAFYVAEALQYSVFPGLAIGCTVAVLFLIGFNRRTLTPGIALFVVYWVAAIFASMQLSPGGVTIADSESNYLWCAVVCLVVPTLVYLMSRRHGLTPLIFVFGAFACMLVQFFYERYELLWCVVFVLASLALCVYKNFQVSVQTATSVRTFSFPAGFATALLSVGLAVLLGCGIWVLVIAPLNPGAKEIKLVTEYWALETERVHGTSNEYQTPNTDLTSDDTSAGGERTVDELWEEADGVEMPGSPYGVVWENSTSSSGSYHGINVDSPEDLFEFETDQIDLSWLKWLLWVLLPLVVVAYFVGRRIVRARRLAAFAALGPTAGAAAIYAFLMGRLGRVGLAISGGLTPREFAHATHHNMRYFDEGMPADFMALTALYTAAAYGDRQLTDEEAEGFKAYYKNFYKAARKYLGNTAYFIRSFKL